MCQWGLFFSTFAKIKNEQTNFIFILTFINITMNKFLLSLIATAAVCTCATGQTFMAAPQAQMYNAPMAEEDLTWLQLCNPNAQASGVGTQAEIELGAAAHFSTDVLSPYKGKEVSVVAICLNTPLTDATVFISEGEDINNATTVAEKTVGYLAGGWNYVQFDTPVTIGDVELSLGFKAIDTKNFPLAFDGQSAKTGGAYISTGGAPFVADSQFGNLMVRMLVDGDPAELENALTLSSVKGGIYQPQGTEIEYELNIANSTYNEVKNATVVWTLNGAENTEDITFDTPIAGNSLTTYNLSIGTLTESASLTFKITKVNGIDNKSIETISKSVRLYDPANTTERTILIEKFTGQMCGYCPGGEESILAAIVGHEDRVARIDHHYGYQNDIFTIDESKQIGNFFGVSGAPNCMMDRTIQEERMNMTGANGVVWHPGYMTTEMVENEISKPSEVTINIESYYEVTNRELTVTVSGKALTDMTGKKINVVLTQSGYSAYQASASNWLHNDFPIVFMSDYKGDALTLDADGNYSMEFKTTVAERYGQNVKVDLEQLKVVAFISDWNNRNSSEVYNAAFAKVDGRVSVEEAESDNETLHFYVADNKVMTDAECEMIEVYSVSGAKVENDNLAKGMYIVRAIAGENEYTGKVVVK